MALPDPPPADERSPNYYDALFAERIRQINRPQERPARQPRGNGVKTVAGILVGIAIALVRILAGSNSPSHTPHYTLPTSITVPKPAQLIDRGVEERDFALPQPNPETFLLEEGDVPVLRGLCYLIEHQSQQAKDSPGKRIWHFLDIDERKLIHETAAQRDLVQELEAHDKMPLPRWRQVLAALNRVLRQPDFYQREAFQDVNMSPRLRTLAAQNLLAGLVGLPETILPLNRWLLEAAYREQVLPQHLRHDPRQKMQWAVRAHADLVLRVRLQRQGIDPWGNR